MELSNKEEIIYDNERPFTEGGGSDSRIPVIYTTSYVGTGTSGKDNPNTLTFDFVPEMVVIRAQEGFIYKNTANPNSINMHSMDLSFFVWVKGTNIMYVRGYPNEFGEYPYNTITLDNNIIKWYADGHGVNYKYYWPGVQMNFSNFTYNVLAIGYKEES